MTGQEKIYDIFKERSNETRTMTINAWMDYKRKQRKRKRQERKESRRTIKNKMKVSQREKTM